MRCFILLSPSTYAFAEASRISVEAPRPTIVILSFTCILSDTSPIASVPSVTALSEYSPSNDPDEDIVSETVYDEAGRVRYSKDVNGAESWIGYDGLDRQERSVGNYSEGDDSFLGWAWDENDGRWEESGAARQRTSLGIDRRQGGNGSES